MNYNLIYDPISKKYKDIYSKSGKLILKNYINKLKKLIGGYPTEIINSELEWGLGIEKEFPILIGPYKFDMLSDVCNNFLRIFNEMFSDWKGRDIKTFVAQQLKKPEFKIEIPQTPESITDGISNITTTSEEQLKNEFYIKFEHFINNRRFSSINKYNSINIFNNDFINYMLNYGYINNDRSNFLTKFSDDERKHCICFFSKWNKFLDELFINDGYLFLYTTKLLEQLIIDIEKEFFKDIIDYISDPKKRQLSIYYEMTDKFDELFNKTAENKKTIKKIEFDKKICIVKTIEFWDTNKIVSLEKKYFEIKEDTDNDFDIGGYEIRTFSKSGETAIKKTVKQCIDNLTEQTSELSKKLSTNLSKWEIQNDVNIIFEDNYASYFLPIYDIFRNEILLKQIYSGDTELNLTLPYVPLEDIDKSNVDLLIHNENININRERLLLKCKFAFQNSFKSRHIYLMKTLQLLSPLFWSCLTGIIYFSFGDNAIVPETSKRYNVNSGYRILTNQKIDDLYVSQSKSDDDELYEDIDTNMYILNILNKNKKIYDNPIPRLSEFSVNRKSEKYSPAENKYFGFEWKVLDQYPSKYNSHICLLIFMIAQWLHNKKINIDFYDDKSLISDIIHTKVHNIEIWFDSILFQGWNSYVSEDYSKLVIESLKLDEFLYMNTKSCYHFLNSIYSNLYRYFKKQESQDIWIIKSFFPEFYEMDDKEYMNLPNINRYNYDKMMNDYQYYFPELFNKHVQRINKDIDNEDYDDLQLYLKNSTKK